MLLFYSTQTHSNLAEEQIPYLTITHSIFCCGQCSWTLQQKKMTRSSSSNIGIAHAITTFSSLSNVCASHYLSFILIKELLGYLHGQNILRFLIVRSHHAATAAAACSSSSCCCSTHSNRHQSSHHNYRQKEWLDSRGRN